MPAAVDISKNPYDNFSRPADTGMGKPVDLSNVGAVNTARGQNYEGRATEAYNWGVGSGDSIWGLGQDISKQALDTGKTFSDWSMRDRAQYDAEVAPAMSEQMRFAREYGNEANRGQRRGQAMAQTGITFDAAADMARRALQSYGVDPSAGRYAGLDAGLAASRAAAQAAAGTKADMDTEVVGQEYLDRAIGRGMVLPGQAANEAGVALAANNQAVNAGVAAGDAANRLRQPSGWVDASQKALDQYQRGLVEQTTLGLTQNRDVMANMLEREKLEQSKSSGAGAAIGAGLGILGTVAGAYFGGPMGASIGGSLGRAAGSGMTVARGGPIRKLPAYRVGGMVRKSDKEAEDDRFNEYRDRGGAEFIAEPYEDVEMEAETPESDTYEESLPPLPNYVEQGYAEGGTVEDMVTDYTAPFRANSGGYDYKSAREAGLGRDETGHMPSREPGSGMLLKGRQHPTFDVGVDQDRRMGYGLEMQNGRYYTQPFQRYAEGGDVEDEFVDTMPEDEMGGEMGEPPMEGNIVPPEASPSGGEETDDVHALVNEGEFIFPKEVTRWYGEKFLQNLIKKAHDEMAQPDLAQPEQAPTQAMAIAPPSFQSAGG